MDPGTVAHHHSASKTRVNALLVLRSIRGTHDRAIPYAAWCMANAGNFRFLSA
jgi:hypothetical protein